MESTSEMETALQFYEAARDNLSLVRVYCYCGNLEKVSSPHTRAKLQSATKLIYTLCLNNSFKVKTNTIISIMF